MSILCKAYPRLNMNDVCRGCKGSPKVFLYKPTCNMCKCNHKDWVDAGYETECEELIYLHNLWLKVKKFKQQSTGFDKLDNCIVFLFGMPHTDFGALVKQDMPKKVATYSKDLNYKPIHLDMTKRELNKLSDLAVVEV